MWNYFRQGFPTKARHQCEYICIACIVSIFTNLTIAHVTFMTYLRCFEVRGYVYKNAWCTNRETAIRIILFLFLRRFEYVFLPACCLTKSKRQKNVGCICTDNFRATISLSLWMGLSVFNHRKIRLLIQSDIVEYIHDSFIFFCMQ